MLEWFTAETVVDSTIEPEYINACEQPDRLFGDVLRRYHLINEINDQGDIHICKVHTNDNIADPLTKGLSQQKHDGHTSSMGIRYMGDWL